jgi:hypothetical protein
MLTFCLLISRSDYILSLISFMFLHYMPHVIIYLFAGFVYLRTSLLQPFLACIFLVQIFQCFSQTLMLPCLEAEYHYVRTFDYLQEKNEYHRGYVTFCCPPCYVMEIISSALATTYNFTLYWTICSPSTPSHPIKFYFSIVFTSVSWTLKLLFPSRIFITVFKSVIRWNLKNWQYVSDGSDAALYPIGRIWNKCVVRSFCIKVNDDLCRMK